MHLCIKPTPAQFQCNLPKHQDNGFIFMCKVAALVVMLCIWDCLQTRSLLAKTATSQNRSLTTIMHNCNAAESTSHGTTGKKLHIYTFMADMMPVKWPTNLHRETEGTHKEKDKTREKCSIC